MLGPDADADEARGNLAQERKASGEAKRERRLDGVAFLGEETGKHAILHDHLERLRHARRKLAPALHGGELLLAELTAAKNVSRGNGVLDGEIDADAADRRHRVGRVTDAKEAVAIPAREPVYLHGEQLDVVPGTDLLHARGGEGHQAAEVRTQLRQSAALQVIDRAL